MICVIIEIYYDMKCIFINKYKYTAYQAKTKLKTPSRTGFKLAAESGDTK